MRFPVSLMASGLALAAMTMAATAGPLTVQITDADGTMHTETYNAPDTVTKPWRVGIMIPHLKDAYWLAAAYGTMAEAERLGISAKLVVAQGYTDITGQLNQLDNLVVEEVDAIILAAVGPQAMAQKVDEIVAGGIPVIGMINPIESESVVARRGISNKIPAAAAGAFMVELVGDEPTKVALFPGPAGSGWAEDLHQGFAEATASKPNIEIVDVKWGDTGKDVQLSLMQNTLQAYPEVNFIVGNPVASEAAPDLLANLGLTDKVRVISMIASPQVIDYVTSGQILMVPPDQTAMLGRLAVDAAVDVLEGREVEAQMGTAVVSVTTETIGSFDTTTTLAPKDFEPVFQVNWN